MDTEMMKSNLEKKLSPRRSNKVHDEGKKIVATKVRKSLSKKTLLPKLKKTKNEDKNYNRLLITINVFGSTGPIRFLVNVDDNTEAVIKTALKIYAREGRLPVLGSNTDTFSLYPADDGFDVLKPLEAIGSRGVRKFILCKNQNQPLMTDTGLEMLDNGKGKKLRAWIQKSLSFKILSHSKSWNNLVVREAQSPESLQVMGSFNGWSQGQGEDLSPEYIGSYATFSTTLMLRPGRYEIKFLVYGEWQLSPEFPITGDGLM